MCLTCGCGEPENDHGHANWLTLGELKKSCEGCCDGDFQKCVQNLDEWCDSQLGELEDSFRVVKVGETADGIPLYERFVSSEERKHLASIGQALPDGSYPIATPGDLGNAVHLAKTGHGNVEGAKALIRKMAKKFGKADPFAESETSMVDGDWTPLLEKSVRADGTIPVKIIAPGWGSSGYYSADVLKKDGPKAFGPGTKMFWDHPTPQEEANRPERSLRDLAAETVTIARFDENGAEGPGLYADAKVFGNYKPAVEELAPHIGVSIRAHGRATMGEAEGRKGKIIQEIVSAESIDFVTKPGAGGKVLQLFEAARGTNTNTGDDDMKLEEAEREIATLKETNARLSETLVLRETGELVYAELKEVQLPEITKTRLAESLKALPTVKDGKLDVDAMKTRIREAVKIETDYIANLTKSGSIRGFGGSNDPDIDTDLDRQLNNAFLGLGLSEAVAKQATQGRSGR